MESLTINDIILRYGPYTLSISRFGAVVTNFGFVTTAGDFVKVIDGYATDAELLECDGYRSAILAPWSNRIADAKFKFAGIEYDLGEREPGIRDALHGLVAFNLFEVLELSDARIELMTVVEPSSSYPFNLEVRVSYEINDDGLLFALKVINRGDTGAPVGLGWHPYFAHHGSWKITLPECRDVSLDDNLIPREGSAAFGLEKRLRELSNLRDWDLPYTDLSAPYALLETAAYRLRMETNLSLNQPGVGVFHVYSGDYLKLRRYESVALEPCEFVTDAFNRSECLGDIYLEPGDKKVLQVGLKIENLNKNN
ncbi:hypothetical protein KRX54_06335 [Actinomycetaceae bacterium TAE3-ERU4]|nr:hypothetical protein [Actinomycetaceae bacterium TAE3-ERU4]